MNIICCFQDFSISYMRAIRAYWIDATLAADGLTWQDSDGAVVNISLWYPGRPINPHNEHIYVGTASSTAVDFHNDNPGFINTTLWCASNEQW